MPTFGHPKRHVMAMVTALWSEHELCNESSDVLRLAAKLVHVDHNNFTIAILGPLTKKCGFPSKIFKVDYLDNAASERRKDEIWLSLFSNQKSFQFHSDNEDDYYRR